MEFKQFITKLNLGSRLFMWLFIGGLALKLIVASFFASKYSSNFFLPFVEYFLNSSFSNPYKYFENSSEEIFPYPILMLFILSAPKAIFGWMASSSYFSVVLIKLPLLIADVAIFFVLKSWLCHKHILKLILLYWFSPVLIYISYIHGQLDAIPIALLFISLYFLFRNSLNTSAAFLGFSMATKTVIIAVVPILIIFLFSQRISKLKILKFLIISFAIFIIINAPYLFDEAFVSSVFNNQQQAKVFLSSIQFGEFYMYLLPIAYCAILLKGISFQTLNKDIFVMFLGFCFAVLLIFTPPSPGWYFWLLPFLFYFYVKDVARGYIFIVLLQLGYLIHFFLQDNGDYFISDEAEINIFVNSGLNYLVEIFGTSETLLHNLTFTILQTALIFNCYWIYVYGLNSFSKQKLISVPFLIGIGGDSGSGKTTVSNALVNIFSSNKSTQLHGDDLHRWERGSENWLKHTHLDPKANKLHHELKILKDLQEWRTVYRKKYNHDTGRFNKALPVRPANLLIYEGLHPFFLKRQRELFDLKIFLNPSKNLNSSWKIKRDTKLRGKSKEDVINQMNFREKDSNNYIKSQLKYADIIIQPFEKTDSVSIHSSIEPSYRITLLNSFNVDIFFEIFHNYKGVSIHHDFLNENEQSLVLEGEITSDNLTLLAYEHIQGLQDLGISRPFWPSNSFGIMIFLITYIINEEAEHGRE